jgi:hypothetical protein
MDKVRQGIAFCFKYQAVQPIFHVHPLPVKLIEHGLIFIAQIDK